MTEMIATQPNRFIEGFIIPNRPKLLELKEVVDEIVAEQTAWQNSGAAEQLARELADEFSRRNIKHVLDHPRHFQDVVSRFRYDIYGTFDDSERNVNHVQGQLKSLSPQAREVVEIVGKKVIEYSADFKRAVRGLTDQKRELGVGLIQQWEEFMTADPRHFAPFAEFLSQEELKALREESRPFLETLQRQSSQLTERVAKTAVEQASTQPNQELFTDFIKTISKDQSNGKDSHQIMRQWLLLVSFPSRDIDSQVILEKILAGAPLPRDLSRLMQEFIAGSLALQVRAINVGLSGFRSTQAPMSTFEFRETILARKKGREILFRNATHKTVGELPKQTERPVFSLALDGQGVLGEEELQRLVQKTADGLAFGDRRMREDIQAMIECLAQDPFGLGVAKIVNAEIPSYLNRYRKLPLRRFRADQRIKLQHPDAPAVRVVYYIDRRGLPNTVILREILDHPDFNKKYGT